MATKVGSTLLLPLSDLIGLPLDQVNFVVCQIFAVGFALWFFKNLSPSKTSATNRHWICVGVGTAMAVFCFGSQVFHLLGQAFLSHIITRYGPQQYAHLMVLGTAMIHLSYTHIWRIIYDYGSWKMDITGPLMISTQRVTSMAFSLHDGLYRKEDKLSADQKKHAIRKHPSLLEILSYVMNFQGVLCGPLCFFNDYQDFITGKSFEKDQEKAKDELTPKVIVVEKLVTSVSCLTAFLTLGPIFPKPLNADKKFISSNTFIQRILFLLISVFLARAKYYFAWKLGEAVNNASGLGFNGYTDEGKAKWDLVDNVRVKDIETSTSFRGIVENWNCQTALWLRRTSYDRLPFQKTLLTYILSAMWHGFYPGYYMSFCGGALVTIAARLVRRNIRPYFLSSTPLKAAYDVFTWFVSQLTLAYLIVPFTVLEMKPILYFYTYSMYWFLHITAILILVVFMSGIIKVKKSSKEPSKQQ